MAYKQPDFHPVLPNITDDSMMEVDADTEMVRRQNDARKGRTNDSHESDAKNKPSTESTLDTNVPPGGTPKHPESSTGRKIIVGILIVVIIVLLLLLIYQIYKYYNMDEVPLLPIGEKGLSISSPHAPGGSDSPKDSSQGPNTMALSGPVGTQKQPPGSCVREDGVIVIPQSTGGIPQHVKNLDNDILSQYIKKGENASGQRQMFIDSKENASARNIGHKTMINDAMANNEPVGEMARISRIIDETRESNTETYTSEVDIPSREDILSQMQKDMVNDQQHLATLESIEEEHGNNIINDFLLEGDDDTGSIKSEDGGCQFVITKGKNSGQSCGRQRSTATRCSRHRGK
jgi:hypothetical protein